MLHFCLPSKGIESLVTLWHPCKYVSVIELYNGNMIHQLHADQQILSYSFYSPSIAIAPYPSQILPLTCTQDNLQRSNHLPSCTTFGKWVETGPHKGNICTVTGTTHKFCSESTIGQDRADVAKAVAL